MATVYRRRKWSVWRRTASKHPSLPSPVRARLPSVLRPPSIWAASPYLTYLILYATGLRNRPSGANVRVTIQGIPAEVKYAGPQPEFEGLDQVNAIIPYGLRGVGNATVHLTIGAVSANPVEIRIQ